MTKLPIHVPGSAAVPLTLTVARYVLTAIGAVLTSRGYLTEDDAAALIGAVLTIAPIVAGIVATRRNVHDKQVMAGALPDSVATIGGAK